MNNLPTTLELLDSLLAFNTVSSEPNADLIMWVRDLLLDAGATVKLIANEDNSKANLFATIGPEDQRGFVLSGHTDVVPITGQHWSVPPFSMTLKDDKVYGRGSADMKGFVACALHAALKASPMNLKTPLHLALSYDEEIGCVGVRSMLDMLAMAAVRPLMCLVGEPTELNVAIGHKGKTACHVSCIGRAGHSALAPQALNAIHLASDLIQSVRQLQTQLAQSGYRDDDFEVPYTTLHVSNIKGGVALNIVPDLCRFDLEIRNLAEDDPLALLQIIRGDADRLVDVARQTVSEADITIELFNSYPGLNTEPTAELVSFVRSLRESGRLHKVAFGTEAGLFANELNVPSVVCGPGSMQQGHKPDEFITLEQLNRCDVMLENLMEHLVKGIVCDEM